MCAVNYRKPTTRPGSLPTKMPAKRRPRRRPIQALPNNALPTQLLDPRESQSVTAEIWLVEAAAHAQPSVHAQSGDVIDINYSRLVHNNHHCVVFKTLIEMRGGVALAKRCTAQNFGVKSICHLTERSLLQPPPPVVQASPAIEQCGTCGMMWPICVCSRIDP